MMVSLVITIDHRKINSADSYDDCDSGYRLR